MYHDIGLFVLTTMVGLFFAVTGYRKIFVNQTHQQVFILFSKLKVPQKAGWAVILGEFFGGLALLFKFLTPLAAFLLLPIMIGAYVLDTYPTVKAKHPDGVTGWISKLICTPEALLIIILITLTLTGAGRYSFDQLLFS